jgi:hypothetical protein
MTMIVQGGVMPAAMEMAAQIAPRILRVEKRLGGCREKGGGDIQEAEDRGRGGDRGD